MVRFSASRSLDFFRPVEALASISTYAPTASWEILVARLTASSPAGGRREMVKRADPSAQGGEEACMMAPVRRFIGPR